MYGNSGPGWYGIWRTTPIRRTLTPYPSYTLFPTLNSRPDTLAPQGAQCRCPLGAHLLKNAHRS
jgi:hypothetical protein